MGPAWWASGRGGSGADKRTHRPGELQFWVERKKLDRVLPFPQGYQDLRMNDNGVMAVPTGVGTARAASTIMALGMDPRFDLTSVLRAGSDFGYPPPGRTAAEALPRTKIWQYSAYLPALEAAYRVGSVVVDHLVQHWAKYRDTTPAARP